MPEVLRDNKLAVPVELTDNAKSLVRALAYFDIFQYPLKKNEIRQFLGNVISDYAFEMALDELIRNRVVFFDSSFLFLTRQFSLAATRRIHGNLRAALLLPAAHKIGRFLYRFPFVRGIGVSGSLSKNFADEKADIDFFIITKPNRLWIARTLMHLLKNWLF